jgi:hypothetical protein
VDRIFQHFQSEFDDTMRKLLEDHFAGIEELLEDSTKNIRGRSAH